MVRKLEMRLMEGRKTLLTPEIEGRRTMEDRVKGKSIGGRVMIFGVVVVWLFLAVACEARIIIVNDDGPADFNNIQAAIDDSNDGDFVVVLPGTYTGEGNRDIDFMGKAITVQSVEPNDPDIVAATVIDCQNSARGFYFHNGEDANSILGGFTITQGRKTGMCCEDDRGGAMYITRSSPTIIQCRFLSNLASNAGGAIWVSSCHPRFIECIFENNIVSPGNSGAAIHNVFSADLVLINCILINNTVGTPSTGGGGVFVGGESSIRATGCIFVSNKASAGGAVLNNGYAWFDSCLFIHNDAVGNGHGSFTGKGGAIANFGWLVMNNCTFYGNSANSIGGGIYTGSDTSDTDLDSVARLKNCILWGNIGEEQGETNQIAVGDTHITIDYSCILGLTGTLGGIGNMNADPCFVDPGYWDANGTPGDVNDDFLAEGDYHLLAGSPCIDAGDPNYVAGPNEMDIDGEPRVMGGRVDMGADEVGVLSVDLDMDSLWMYQNIPSASGSSLTATASITYDPNGNSSYSYEWEIILPGDVSLAPVTVGGGGASDGYWTFAARGCDEPGGLSDSGQTFTVRVIITGDDYGNTGQAEAEFGIALLGDVNNDGIINVADRSIANAFWRLGSVGAYTLRDCDVNSDGIVNVADRSIANAVWRGILGQNSVSEPCPLR